VPTVLELVDFLDARDQLPGVEWSARTAIRRPASIEDAEEGDVSFISASGTRAEELLEASNATLILIGEAPTPSLPARAGAVAVRCRNPRLDFIRVIQQFFAPARPTGIHPTAVIDVQASVAVDAYVGPLATIGAGVVVGARTVIHAGVHVLAGCRIGADCTIHPGTVIGSDGFGFERTEDGMPERFPHLGTVVIEDNVEIGANACIDRAALGATLIRCGARIDNLVYIGHGVEVGRGALVMTLSSVGGRTRLGERSWIAPSSTLRDGLSVGHDATVGLGALVISDVPVGTTVAGSPARELAELRAMNAALRDLVSGPDRGSQGA
jgi:UDP-3-O-[3-hydroxymyristoyl] glucosamine N-acyltransferase